jgi:hypothetical protein
MRYLYWPGLVLAACLLVLILFPLAEKTYRSVYGEPVPEAASDFANIPADFRPPVRAVKLWNDHGALKLIVTLQDEPGDYTRGLMVAATFRDASGGQLGTAAERLYGSDGIDDRPRDFVLKPVPPGTARVEIRVTYPGN